MDRIYTQRITPQLRIEILRLLKSGDLLKGKTTYGGMIKLVYENGVEAATFCPKCKQIFGESTSNKNNEF